MPRQSKVSSGRRSRPDAARNLDRDAGAPLYEQLAARIEALIASGTFVPGERIPSVRKARIQFGVSASTVVEAYRLLEARGVIRSLPQSGSFVRESAVERPSLPAPSSPPLRCIALEPCDATTARFKTAVPDPSLLPTKQVARSLTRIYREDPEVAVRYAAPGGHEDLRREIARRMLDAGCQVAPDDVVVTNGANEALFLALSSSTEPGDTVAIESPTYPGIISIMRGLRLKALPIATCPGEGLCVGAFEQAVAKRKIAALVVSANYSNPLGALIPLDERRRLLDAASARGVVIIEDDVDGELSFDDVRPPALRSIRPDVLYCSSFSKILAPGLRVGWCLPGPRLGPLLDLKVGLNVSNALGPQLAVARLLTGGGFDNHLRTMRRTCRTLVARFTEHTLASFPRGTRTSRPTGGFVLWVELPPGIDTEVLLETARGHGISFAPGPLFCPVLGYRNCLRFNCAVLWSDDVAAAIRTVGVLAHRQLADAPSLARG